MSRDKTALPGADMPPSWTDARPPLVVLPLLLCPSHLSCFSLMLISLLMSLPSHLPLVILSVMLCHSCCLFLSPAVSLSGLGVGFGDSVLWILPWLRPKLLGPHGAAASPGPLPAHPFLLFFSPLSFFFSWHLNFGQHQLLLQTFPLRVSLLLPLYVTYCSEETPCDSPSTVSFAQGCSLPGFQS